jgi:hypothetical protein
VTEDPDRNSVKGSGRHRRPVDRKKLRYPPRPFLGPSDFTYDSKRKTLICPAGKDLRAKVRHFRDSAGYLRTAYTGRVRDCRACSLQSTCLRKRRTAARQVVIFNGRNQEASPTSSQRMMERFDTACRRFLHGRRIGTVEPVFANACYVHGLDHFPHRGRAKVDIPWNLQRMLHNILTILRFWPRLA